MSNISKAWLLEANGGDTFVVAEYEMIEYIITPELIKVPLTPNYCSSLVLWSDKLIPVVNFSVLTSKKSTKERSVSILAYQEAEGEDLQYVGVYLQKPPTKISINDNQACDLQDIESAVWKNLSVSCFTYSEAAVPILGVEKLATAAFRH